MAGLETSGSNPDVSLLYDINALAREAPGWVDRMVQLLGEYGLLVGAVLLLLACWGTQRRRAGSLDAAVSTMAALIWTPLAAGIAVLVNIPIRGLVERPSPSADHDGLRVLIRSGHDYSFVSDHATLAMAMAAGLFVANRSYGLLAMVLAFAEGFCRVFMGVHYPTDVIGGYALGAAVALLLSPLASAALTPLTKAMARSTRTGWLIRARTGAEDSVSSSGDSAYSLRSGNAVIPGASGNTGNAGNMGNSGFVESVGAVEFPDSADAAGAATGERAEDRPGRGNRDERAGLPGADVRAGRGRGRAESRREHERPSASRSGAARRSLPGGSGQGTDAGRQGPGKPGGPRDSHGPREPNIAA